MMYYRPFTYVYRVDTLAAGGQDEFSFRMQYDYLLYEFCGVPDVALIEDVTANIYFSDENRYLSNIPVRCPLVAVPAPGDSSWKHPRLCKKGSLITVTLQNNTAATSFDFDFALFGYHHQQVFESPPPVSPVVDPQRIHYYVWDFGDVEIGADLIERWRCDFDRHFVALGFVATDTAAANGNFEYRLQNEARPEYWSDDFIGGAAMFPNTIGLPRRLKFRIPYLVMGGETMALNLRNLSGGTVNNVAVAMYGYFIKDDRVKDVRERLLT